jgi:hypothetical protein
MCPGCWTLELWDLMFISLNFSHLYSGPSFLLGMGMFILHHCILEICNSFLSLYVLKAKSALNLRDF